MCCHAVIAKEDGCLKSVEWNGGMNYWNGLGQNLFGCINYNLYQYIHRFRLIGILNDKLCGWYLYTLPSYACI